MSEHSGVPDLKQTVLPSDGLVGSLDLPADKSIAHRSALFAAIGEGTSEIIGFPTSADPQSTLSCLRQLGVEIRESEKALHIVGRGLRGLQSPTGPIDCGNSGTTMRLLSGILSGRPFDSTLIGDVSLSSRPMGRIIDPLSEMGVSITTKTRRPPFTILAQHRALDSIEYRLPIASAQVKSCILLAGLSAGGISTVIEPQTTRDHTERMLGLSSVVIDGTKRIDVEGEMRIPARKWSIPSDFSAAAFFMVAASIIPGSNVKLPDVGLNPTRTGLLDVLRTMGADIAIDNVREVAGEPIGDMTVRHAQLSGMEIDEALISNLIDEVPILCIAALAAEGKTTIRHAEELRHKESDRIDAMVKGLRSLGVRIEEFEDGVEIEGGQSLNGGNVSARHDHRIAMAFAVAGLAAKDPVTIEGAAIADVSFPGFYDAIDSLR